MIALVRSNCRWHGAEEQLTKVHAALTITVYLLRVNNGQGGFLLPLVAETTSFQRGKQSGDSAIRFRAMLQTTIHEHDREDRRRLSVPNGMDAPLKS